MSAPPAPAGRGILGALRLVATAAEYEFRKVSVFRAGFLVREVLQGVVQPIVMIAVYLAVYRAVGQRSLRGWTFDEIVHYMILAAGFQKLVFHHRILDLSVQIFDGYVTKFLVMPFSYFLLPLGRWVQYGIQQLVVCATLWALGAFLLPEVWPAPESAVRVAQALCLALLGSFCHLQLYFILNALAFWLDIIWTLLVMAKFVTAFAGGVLMPVSQMPGPLREIFAWTFPYWTISAPIELFLGRLGSADFARGVAVLGGSIAVLEVLRRVVWARGTRRYSGAGM